MDNEKEFEVEISNTGPKSYETATILRLPATWAEFNDALQKARIEDACFCKNELTMIRRKEIPACDIGQNVNLFELNLLAQRLSDLTEDQYMGFDGLRRIEREKRDGAIPLSKLINFTFNSDICLLAPHIFTDRDLGEFLYEGELFPEDVMTVMESAASDTELLNSLFAIYGQKHRLDVDGTFTPNGYVEPSEVLQEVYAPDKPGEITPYFNRSGAPVVLQVCKSRPNDLQHNEDLVTTLDLPAQPSAIWRAVEAVKASSVKECSFRCIDCLVPSLREAITTSITDTCSLDAANEFAGALDKKERIWYTEDFVKYKALLDAVSDPSIQDAHLLMDNMEQYELLQDVTQPSEYAETVLREKYPDLPEELFHTGQSVALGMKMLEETHAAITDYGLIRRIDGSPLPTFEPEAHESPESEFLMT